MKRLRGWHRLISTIILLPAAVILISGVVLLYRQQLPMIHPAPAKAQFSKTPVPITQIMERARLVKEAEIHSVNDIAQIDIRPGKGLVRVRAKNRTEIQFDWATGKVLQVQKRYTGWLIALHEGSLFGQNTKYFIFAPAAIGLVFLWFSGLYLMIQYYTRAWRRRRKVHRCHLQTAQNATKQAPPQTTRAIET